MNTLHSSLVDLGARWLAELEVRPSTQRAYQFEIHRLARWASVLPDARLSTLPGELLTDFLSLLASTKEEEFTRVGLARPAKDSSLLQAKRILSAMFEWASAGGLTPVLIGYTCRRWQIPKNRALPKPKGPMPRRTRASSHSLERVRNEFIVALAQWAGARPQDISSLLRRDVRLRGEVLQVCLPNGKNEPVDTFLPPVAAKAWKALSKQLRPGEYAVTGATTGRRLTPSRIARIIAETGMRSENARALRAKGIQQFRDAGWPEATIRVQLRRQTIRLGDTVEAKSIRLGRVSQIAPSNTLK